MFEFVIFLVFFSERYLSVSSFKNAINLYEMQIENADQLGELSQEAQADYDLKIKQLEALEQGAQGQAQGRAEDAALQRIKRAGRPAHVRSRRGFRSIRICVGRVEQFLREIPTRPKDPHRLGTAQ